MAAHKQVTFTWEGVDRSGKEMQGEMKSVNTTMVTALLRRQGIKTTKVKRARRISTKVTEEEVTLLTRQLSTMLRAGVPMLQAFDIVGQGHNNPAAAKLLLTIRADIETGSSLKQAFSKHPQHFDKLFCNLIGAGEAAGILDTLLDRLATYKEKTLALKSKIKSALFYPISIIVIAFVITAVIMIFVIPAFKGIFADFGAELPAITKIVINISDVFVRWWWLIFGGMYAALHGFFTLWRKEEKVQRFMDKLTLRLPVFGSLIKKAVISRWCRTLSTMFSAGVPIVESLDSVAGAAGNFVFFDATRVIQREISTGNSLYLTMQNSKVFPKMVLQMVAIGEESGTIDQMLNKVADFYEREVDDAVEGLSSLMEPVIMVVLGALIGGMVVAMYLPIFQMGQVV